MTDRIIIFDTTLRDGEQSPGASMTLDEKVRIAKNLEKMRVDVIEAGFPVASQGDFESVRAVANTVKDSTVCGLARALKKDINRAGEALKGANSGRIHTFIATSGPKCGRISASHSKKWSAHIAINSGKHLGSVNQRTGVETSRAVEP